MTLSVQDYIDIQQLYARYTFAFDLRDTDAWLNCFTEDGELGFAEGGEEFGVPAFVTKGHDDLRSTGTTIMGMPENKGFHWNASLVITPTETGASGQCYLMFLAAPKGTGEPRMAGYYRDELVKSNGKWLFQRRIVHFLP
jgi:hypothetical protein